MVTLVRSGHVGRREREQKHQHQRRWRHCQPTTDANSPFPETVAHPAEAVGASALDSTPRNRKIRSLKDSERVGQRNDMRKEVTWSRVVFVNSSSWRNAGVIPKEDITKDTLKHEGRITTALLNMLGGKHAYAVYDGHLEK